MDVLKDIDGDDVQYFCDFFFKKQTIMVCAFPCIKNGLKINEKHKGFARFLSPVKWRKISKTIIIIIEIDVCYEIAVFTSRMVADVLQGYVFSMLSQTKKINFNVRNKHVVFREVPHNILPGLKSLINSKCLEIEKEELFLVYKSSTKNPLLKTKIPNGVELKPLEPGNAALIFDIWPHFYPPTAQYISRLIEVSDGYGLFSEKGELLSWGLRTTTGTIGFVQTVEEDRRKGYASYIVSHLALNLIQEDLYPVAFLGLNDCKSKFLFEKLGFKFAGLSYNIQLKLKKEVVELSTTKENKKESKALQRISSPSQTDLAEAGPSTKVFSCPVRIPIPTVSAESYTQSPSEAEIKRSAGWQRIHDFLNRKLIEPGLSWSSFLWSSKKKKKPEVPYSPIKTHRSKSSTHHSPEIVMTEEMPRRKKKIGEAELSQENQSNPSKNKGSKRSSAVLYNPVKTQTSQVRLSSTPSTHHSAEAEVSEEVSRRKKLQRLRVPCKLDLGKASPLHKIDSSPKERESVPASAVLHSPVETHKCLDQSTSKSSRERSTEANITKEILLKTSPSKKDLQEAGSSREIFSSPSKTKKECNRSAEVLYTPVKSHTSSVQSTSKLSTDHSAKGKITKKTSRGKKWQRLLVWSSSEEELTEAGPSPEIFVSPAKKKKKSETRSPVLYSPAKSTGSSAQSSSTPSKRRSNKQRIGSPPKKDKKEDGSSPEKKKKSETRSPILDSPAKSTGSSAQSSSTPSKRRSNEQRIGSPPKKDKKEDGSSPEKKKKSETRSPVLYSPAKSTGSSAQSSSTPSKRRSNEQRIGSPPKKDKKEDGSSPEKKKKSETRSPILDSPAKSTGSPAQSSSTPSKRRSNEQRIGSPPKKDKKEDGSSPEKKKKSETRSPVLYSPAKSTGSSAQSSSTPSKRRSNEQRIGSPPKKDKKEDGSSPEKKKKSETRSPVLYSPAKSTGSSAQSSSTPSKRRSNEQRIGSPPKKDKKEAGSSRETLYSPFEKKTTETGISPFESSLKLSTGSSAELEVAEGMPLSIRRIGSPSEDIRQAEPEIFPSSSIPVPPSYEPVSRSSSEADKAERMTGTLDASSDKNYSRYPLIKRILKRYCGKDL